MAVCDLKGENIILSLTEMGAGYNIKIMDLGGAYFQSNDSIDINSLYPIMLTKLFFNIRLWKTMVNKKMPLTDKQLIQSEIFTLGRTIQ